MQQGAKTILILQKIYFVKVILLFFLKKKAQFKVSVKILSISTIFKMNDNKKCFLSLNQHIQMVSDFCHTEDWISVIYMYMCVFFLMLVELLSNITE